MQPPKNKFGWTSIFRAFLIMGLLLSWQNPACATVTLTNNSLSAFTSALASGGLINLAFNGTIAATNTLQVVSNTTLNAAGFNVTISGGNSNRVFTVATNITFSATNLTIAFGNSAGTNGNNGTAGATNFASNGGNGGNAGNGGNGLGGAIFNQGTNYFVNCSFLTNCAIGGNGGTGGIGGNSTVDFGGSGGAGGNGGTAYGGAVYNLNFVVFSNCTFAGNSVTAGNGGNGGTNGTPLEAGSPYPGNGGTGGVGAGAGLYSIATAVAYVYDCTFTSNAIVAGNTQKRGGGYAGENGTSGLGGGNAEGGGICNLGTNWVINCTFYTNSIVGGKGGSGENAQPTYGTYGGGGAGGGSGLGGNIYNAGFMGITNCTLVSGAVYGGAGGSVGSGVATNQSNGPTGTASGANLYNASGTLDLKNSILSNPVNDSNGEGTITDQGYNISSDATPSGFGVHSTNNVNPQLMAFGNYGGPTLTFALQPASPAIGFADTNAAPLQDQRGYWWYGYASSGAYDYGAYPIASIYLYAMGPSASEDGDVGLFYFERSPWGSPGPLTINYTITGTATNGVNYATITNSFILPVGVYYSNILVQTIPGSFSGTNLTVTLTAASNALVQVDSVANADTVYLYPTSKSDPAARFIRGTTTAPQYQSFVIPLDSEVGVALAAIGGNATTLFPGNPWTTNLYHYNGTNLNSQTGTNGRIVFQNPIVAFGSPSGGSPLYIGDQYNFGMYSGYSDSVRINVYYRSNSALAGTITLPIPSNLNDPVQLNGFVTNGFTVSTNAFGLQTTLFMPSAPDWGLLFTYSGNFVMTHTASATATNYYYEVEDGGFTLNYDYMVRNQSGGGDWDKMYVLEFTPFPTGRSKFVDQPQFNGIPLPPTYQGMSLQELTNVVPTLPNLSALVPTNYMKIDLSPELRRHPILDQFVKNMNNDPLALANYVINEIDLTDAIDYDTNYNSQPAINLGGVDRGALATFEEGQGSPVEQCALLIYLLRQAGVPAAYVYPTNNGLQMLDFQVSKLLRTQLHGALSEIGQTNMPQLISVNYPWVAAYIGTNWIQIFPWLKDTSIIEGLDLYAYMPTNYNSGYKWLTHFIAGDTNIFSLSNTSDQPLDLLPLFIQKNLDANFPGISVGDLGVQIVNRRHLYSQWSQFPLPFSLSGTPKVVESLSTNMNLFNTVDILIYSQVNPGNAVDTLEIPVLYLHNRKFLLDFTESNTNSYEMNVFMSPYSSNITDATFFGPGVDFAEELLGGASLSGADDNIIFQVTHRRNKFLPTNYVAALTQDSTNLWNYNYFEAGQVGNSQTYVTTNTFRKGDWVAFCMDTGRVTQNMLNVWAQDIWQNGQNQDPNVYLGTTAYLMGMSYFNYVDRFSAFNDPLHKIQLESSFEYGFGVIRPERTATGALTNGAIIPITPSLHMPDNGLSTIFNSTLRPDQGRDLYSAFLDWWLQKGVQGSAAEHGILETYCQTNAISSVRLLQQAGTNAVALNAVNYLSAATNLYHGVQLQNADPVLWATVVAFFNTNDFNRQAFLTPGIVTNGAFIGAGGILFSQTEVDSPVGGFNGGFADPLPPAALTQANSGNVTVNPAPDDATSPYILTTTSPVNNAAAPVDGAPIDSSLPTTQTDLNNGTQALDPNMQQAGTNESVLYGITITPPAIFGQGYNGGTLTTTLGVYGDQTSLVAEPVNVMSGEFYIDAVDLTLPGPLNLQVRRNYSSQNQVENEFGFGWKINYMPYLSMNTNGSLFYAAEMDGSVIAYRQTNTSVNIWVPTMADNPMLDNNNSQGIGSLANSFNNILRLSTVGGTNIYKLTGADGSVRTFITNSFPIGTFTRLRPYLTTWQDNRGNAYSFSYGTNSTQPDYGELNRIQSMSGSYLGFYYDVYGHIIQAYTGDGRILNYVYDKFGDLVTVTLPDQSQINYVYQHANMVTNSVTNLYSTHLILQELKPNGRIVQNIYDSQRRVTNQMSTVGADLNPIRTATFVYSNNFNISSPTNLLTGTTTVYDYTNHVMTYAYTNSLINVIVDPLSQTITQTWYGANTNGGYQRSLKSRMDKRGLTTSYLYDAFGNVTNTTVTGDLTGSGITTNAVTTVAYNTNNQPLVVTDPLGNAQQYIYDSTYVFLPQQVIRLAQGTPVATNLFIYTNATSVMMNGTNTVTNAAFGLLARRIRANNSPDAATNDMFYGGNGFVTATIQYTGTGDPAITNQYLYNERNELVQQTDAAGRTSTFTYDPMGRPTSRETFESGQTVPMDWNDSYYNENGDLTWTDGARYNPEDYVWRDYDGDGRKIQEIHWQSQANPNGSGVSAVPGYNLYATSFYQYDPLGDLIQATDTLGNYVVQSYDAIGQLIQQTYYASNGTALATNYLAHEPGGLVSSATNAIGGVTTKLYTSTGKLKFQQNPDGSTHSWAFDLTGRLVKETVANGNYWLTLYNDSLNSITNIFNNGSGPLETNITLSDLRGNARRSIDAYGSVWTNLYDGLDRIKIAAGPAATNVANVGFSLPLTNFVTNVFQKLTTYLYDNSGKVLTVSNALGETTVTTSDAIGRPIQVAIYNSNSVTPVRFTGTFYSPDHNSVTVTNGTGTNAIITTGYTDTAGKPLLNIGYPSAGVTEFSLWQYDAAENCIAQLQCSSNSSGVTVWATNGWTYDGLNRVATETTKDGATTTYTRDAMGNVLNRAMPGSLTWSATYLNDGRIATEQESGGSLTARSMSYAYYGTNSSFVGQLLTVTDGRGTTRTNTYDDFMRLAQVTSTGSTAQQQTSTTYQYDLRNLLTSLSQSFASTNTGPSTAVTRGYDSYGRILTEATAISGASISVMNQTWDVGGRRSQLNGVPFNHQADGLMIASDGSVFGYANNGLLVGRTNASRNYAITQRDGKGRVLGTTTTVGISTALTETLAWRNDGRLTNYVASRDFTDTRNYSYSPLAQRLTQESFNVASGSHMTNNYTIDNNATGGLGILTSKTEGGAATASWTVPGSGGLDGLSRVAQSQNTLINRPTYGTVQGAGTVTATLDGNPVAVQFDGSGGSGQWRANLDMSSGSHTLSVSAVDPSGNYSGSSNSTFTVASGAVDTVTNIYDGNGNITQRMWINNLGQTNRIETLVWDAFDRLIQETDRDTNNSGFNFVAIFDGLGRRIRTIETLVTNGVPITSPASSVSTVDSWYDPQVEFLEAAVNMNGNVTVKTYGPDASGTYGGMQGVGGLESIYRTDHFYALGSVQDYFGNIIGTITNHTVLWNPARFSSYGPVPGYQPLTLSLDTSVAQTVGWHGLRMDPDGNYHIGRRRYGPTEGRWLSADPMGHAASMDLYSYCDSDPVNKTDADGQMSKYSYTPSGDDFTYNFVDGMINDSLNLVGRAGNGIAQAGAIGYDMVAQTSWALGGAGGDYQGYSQLYQNIYNDPSTGPTSGQILLGTAKTELNLATLGAYGMAQGTYNGIQTGNWSQAQDASLSALFISSGVQGMQSQGINPWSAGYMPTAADQALLSLFKSDSSDTPPAAPAGMQPQPVQQQQAQSGSAPSSGSQTSEQAGISSSDALRIQNAADRTGQQITVVGSRAAGTAGSDSDWDYIFSGPSAARHSAASSVPVGNAGGAIGASGTESGIDIWQDYNPEAPGYTTLDPKLPHVTFTPKH